VVTVVSIHQTYSASPVFRIYRTEGGRWCARASDGSVGGTFFERSAALRFAEREGASVLVPGDDLGLHAGVGPSVAKC
jgi:hypothetical protein